MMWHLITILHAKVEVNWWNIARVFRATVMKNIVPLRSVEPPHRAAPCYLGCFIQMPISLSVFRILTSDLIYNIPKTPIYENM